jgi:tetratricopeptide (TPR) repeat protein
VTAFLVGCGGGNNNPRGVDPDRRVESDKKDGDARRVDDKTVQPVRTDDVVVNRLPGLSDQERFDAALVKAVQLQGERKYPEALKALQEAAAIIPGDQIQAEIERLNARIALHRAGEQAVQDIRLVLSNGKADAAALLGADALKQYGGSEWAGDLEQLKRQADALVSAAQNADDARKTRFRDDAEAALKDDKNPNLRAAAIALEQLLQLGEDPDRRKQLDAVHDRLQRYDDNRRRAAELRRDSASYEDALACLKKASDAWDNLDVRQEIDEITVLLQKRRDRLSVADFDARGEVGADLGKTLAENLLPEFKARFDLVEREQIGKVLDELKLEGNLSEDDRGRREVGRLAKVRYLVVGSVSRLGGLAINARLVDVQSGLIVQTARVIAATPEELTNLLPQLAAVLQMTDEQKIAFEQKQAQQVAAVQPVAADAALPPPPPPPAPDVAPPQPIVAAVVAPPPLGDVQVVVFEKLPRQPVTPIIVVERELPIKRKLLRVSLELGDNLYRRGRYREAHAQFQLCLDLADDRSIIQTRIDQCVPFLPPPVVIATPRPRLAVFNFLTQGDPRVVSPGLGPWTAEQIAPYFFPTYEIVDRAEVFYYMARLGLSVRDVLLDPAARRWLGRALNVRYFLFGAVRETASFDVETHLLDVEFGCEIGGARVHVQNPFELKCRLYDLARWTLDPNAWNAYQASLREQERLARLAEAERLRALRECNDYDVLVLEAQRFDRAGNVEVSFELFGRAGKLRPDSIEVNVFLGRRRDRDRWAALAAARQDELRRQQELLVQAQQRQIELARAAEAERIRAEREAAARTEAERLAWQRQQELAYQQMLLQGDLALKSNNFTLSIQIFRSAAAVRGSDEAFARVARAQALANEEARLRSAREREAREAAVRQQQEAALLAARAQVEQERQRVNEPAEKLRREREALDAAQYKASMERARTMIAKLQYESALAELQTARRLHPGVEVDVIINETATKRSEELARKKGEAEVAALKARQAAEEDRRKKAEAEAVRNRTLYEAALQKADAALAAKQYETAAARYEEANKALSTPVALNGLAKARALQREEQARLKADADKRAAEAAKATLLKQTRNDAEAALAAKKYDDAVRLWSKASELAPADVEVLASLNRAKQAQAEAATQARLAGEKAKADQVAAERATKARQMTAEARKAMEARRYADAEKLLADARTLAPQDAGVAAAAQELERIKKQPTPAETAAQKKLKEDFTLAMDAGRDAVKKQNYTGAVNAYKEAVRLMPDSKDAADSLRSAERLRDQTAAAQGEAKKLDDFKKLTGSAQVAFKEKRYQEAVNAYNLALKLYPADAAALKGLSDANKALADEAGVAADRKKREVAFAAAMKSGAAAMTAKDYAAAVKAFTEATQQLPDNKDAAAQLAAARTAQATADADARRRTEEAKKKADFDALMKQAQTAATAGKHDDAVNIYSAALKLYPTDPGALKGLADARSAAGADVERKKKEAAFAAALKSGNDALTAKNYDAAIKAFSDAAAMLPGDRRAADGLQAAKAGKAAADAEAKKKADFDRLMGQGRDAMTRKQYADAVKFYTDAAKLMPSDAAAAKAVRDAQAALDASKKPMKP